MLDKISKPRTRVTKGEHVRRALDAYLSQPLIQEALRQYEASEALVELPGKPETLGDLRKNV